MLKFRVCQGLPSGRFVSEVDLENSLKLSGLIIMELRVCPQATSLPSLDFVLKHFAAMIFWLTWLNAGNGIFQHAL